MGNALPEATAEAPLGKSEGMALVPALPPPPPQPFMASEMTHAPAAKPQNLKDVLINVLPCQ
jgi:hypothetical protein